MEITWVCDACAEEVGSDGHLLVRTTDQRRWQREHQAYLGRTTDTPALPGSGPGAYPFPCSWQVLHPACDRDPDDVRYSIGTGEIASLREVVRWTSHLMKKPWVGEETDWLRLLERLARNASNAR